ncbi:MAG TPA: hypothetical protein VN673_00990, partial [Clostridia bacterium]|nr:hypothetical protein [Clostridia bacterium]
MKSNRARIGLSILAGSLSFVGTSSALDLVIDGSYESSTNNMVNAIVGLGVDSGGAPDMGWTAFTTYTYAAGYTQPGTTGSGQVYLRPYDSLGGSRTVSQTVSLTRAVTEAQIDSTTGQFTASAWFSTYLGQNDYSTLTLEFLDLNMQPIGSTSTLGGAAFVAAIPGGSGARAWGNDTKTGGIPVGARYAKITTVGTALSGSPDGYVDLVSLDVTSGFVPISLASSPLNGATGVTPARLIQATLTDGTASLNPASLLLVVDGAAVTPSVSKTDNVTALAYSPGGLWAPLSPHSYYVAYGNTGGATPNTTNQFAFTVAPYVDAKLGPPLYLETFDTIAETELPAGWSVESYTDSDLPWLDINDFRSDYYTNWVVISRSTLTNLTAVVPDGPDFLAAFNVAPNQVVNGSVITNLIETNFIFAVADRGAGNPGQPDGTQKQIQYLFTRDFDLTGKTNIYLAFHNIYVQNQDSMGAVEYSINGGATWLPALYMLEPADVLTDSAGSINASNTFAARHFDVPDLDAGTLTDGFYGRYIAVHSNQWASLAPFISPRTDNDATSSKRVE